MVRKNIDEHIRSDFDGDLDSLFDKPIEAVIKSFVTSKKECEDAGYTDIKVVVCWEDYGEGCSLDLHGRRKETDKEMHKRIEKQKKEHERERKKQEKQDAKDLAEYTRLKAKFEGE